MRALIRSLYLQLREGFISTHGMKLMGLEMASVS